MRRHGAALAVAIILAIALPWLLLRTEQTPLPSLPPIDGLPLHPAPAIAIDAVLARAPFQSRDTMVGAEEKASGEADGDEADPDAPPRIVGVVGRLPDQAIVLIRRSAGGTRTLGVGESSGRWQLVSIAADAALFSDGTRRVRVELPAADPP